jgi:hypothetical protein
MYVVGVVAWRDDARCMALRSSDDGCAVRGPVPMLQVLQVLHVVHVVHVTVPALQGANRCLGKRRRMGDANTMELLHREEGGDIDYLGRILVVKGVCGATPRVSFARPTRSP